MGCLSLLIADDLQGYEHGSTEPTEPLGEVERFELINGRALRADRRGGALRVNKRKSATSRQARWSTSQSINPL